MMLTRRALLAAAPAAFAARPNDDLLLDPVSADTVRLRRLSERDGLILPASRTRIVARLSLGGHDLMATAFAGDPDNETAIDLLALSSVDAGTPARLLALEILSYADADGTRLGCRLATTSDASRVLLTRTASAYRSPTLVVRSGWIDYLGWRDKAPLASLPIHPPPDGSWAALLADRRARVQALLTPTVTEISPALLRDTQLLRPLRL